MIYNLVPQLGKEWSCTVVFWALGTSSSYAQQGGQSGLSSSHCIL